MNKVYRQNIKSLQLQNKQAWEYSAYLDIPYSFIYNVENDRYNQCKEAPSYKFAKIPSSDVSKSDFIKEKCIMKYVCSICGWVYDEDGTGVKWEDLPDDFACELCGVGKESFEPQEA